jgi:hypothetical protein
MTEWANYDIDGKRVPPKRAVFRAKEVSVALQLRAHSPDVENDAGPWRRTSLPSSGRCLMW